MTFGGVDRMTRHMLAKANALEVPQFREAQTERPSPLEVAAACGFTDPDEWQRGVLMSTASKEILCCSRQSGKSTTTAVSAVDDAVHEPGSTILILTPSLRQSTELTRKVYGFYHALTMDKPAALGESALKLELDNGSRVIALPGNEATARGYTATRVIVDEAAKVPDALLASVLPSLATTHGRLTLMSTPAGKRGFFWDAWSKGDDWERTLITVEQIPRITQEHLNDMRAILGEFMWRQEYFCEFLDPETSVFSSDLIEAMIRHDLEPFWPVGA